ncbi:MAG: hypothetical protein AB7G62_13365 [Magnetospirillum sp.]
MSFALPPSCPPVRERRYDGPVPAHAESPATASGLIQRLAAQSREHGARRRRRLGAPLVLSDSWLRRHVAALADYRALAVSGHKIP